MKGIAIKGIETYYPEYTVSVDSFVSQLKDMGQELEKNKEMYIRNVLGKDVIHVIKDTTKENSVTLAIEAAKKVLKSTGMTGADIDMTVLSAVLPEYVMPPCSVIIHKAIGGKSTAICYDNNLNCLGMTFSLSQIYKHMAADPNINRVLLIGSERLSSEESEKNIPQMPGSGDGACAIILDKIDGDSGLIDVRYQIDTATINEFRTPKMGFSHMYDEKKDEEHAMILGATDAIADLLKRLEAPVKHIKELLEEHEIEKEEVATYCFSQNSLICVEQLKKMLGLSTGKALYVGNNMVIQGQAHQYSSRKGNNVQEEGTFNEVEISIKEIFEEVLNTKCYTPQDEFFSLGGNSLDLASLMTKLNETFSVEVNMMEIMSEASIEGLAKYIIELSSQKLA